MSGNALIGTWAVGTEDFWFLQLVLYPVYRDGKNPISR